MNAASELAVQAKYECKYANFVLKYDGSVSNMLSDSFPDVYIHEAFVVNNRICQHYDLSICLLSLSIYFYFCRLM